MHEQARARARAHARTHPRTHAPTHPRTHAPTHPRTHTLSRLYLTPLILSLSGRFYSCLLCYLQCMMTRRSGAHTDLTISLASVTACFPGLELRIKRPAVAPEICALAATSLFFHSMISTRHSGCTAIACVDGLSTTMPKKSTPELSTPIGTHLGISQVHTHSFVAST